MFWIFLFNDGLQPKNSSMSLPLYERPYPPQRRTLRYTRRGKRYTTSGQYAQQCIQMYPSLGFQKQRQALFPFRRVSRSKYPHVSKISSNASFSMVSEATFGTFPVQKDCKVTKLKASKPHDFKKWKRQTRSGKNYTRSGKDTLKCNVTKNASFSRISEATLDTFPVQMQSCDIEGFKATRSQEVEKIHKKWENSRSGKDRQEVGRVIEEVEKIPKNVTKNASFLGCQKQRQALLPFRRVAKLRG